MTQRPKLELELNKPVEITLLYDEPITGESQYGHYNLYAVESEGVEYSFFAPEEVHKTIKNLQKGDSVIITKKASQNGNGKIAVSYDVLVAEKTTAQSLKSIEEILDDMPPLEKEESGEAYHDNLYGIMLRSLQDAVDIANKLGSMVDANRIGITLFIARSKTNAYGG